MEFKDFSLIELDEMVRAGKATYQEIYDYFCARSKKYNDALGAYITLPEEKNEVKGLPVAVKDLFCEVGVRTTAASKMLENFVPPYESTVTERMKKSGFIAFGKTNLDEFAMGGSGENSAFGATKNPWDTTRIPGGSSSGSAAAVAAGLVPAALGTDTGGSIRQPASLCGVVGFKPGYGRNSRAGVIAMASSLDCPGYFTKTVRDSGWLYEATAGHDSKDATSLMEPVKLNPDIWQKTRLDGVKVGVPQEYFADGTDAGVRENIEKTIEKMRDLGAEIVDISLPHTKEGISVYYIICPAEVATNMARYDGLRFGEKVENGNDIVANRSALLGKEVQRRSLVGSFVLSAGSYEEYYQKASLVRELIRDDFRKAFEKVDVIVTPTAPTVAWKIGEKGDDPMAAYLEDVFTVPASLAGLPGLVIPVGYAASSDVEKREMPVGIQILGPVLGEEKVLEVGHILEQSLKDSLTKKPEIF